MMNSKLRDSKTRQIDDKNRSAIEETIKVKKGFSQNARESSKRNAALGQMGHKCMKMQPREKGVLDPEQIGLVPIKVWNIDTGKSEIRLINLESVRKAERECDRLAADLKKETRY